jgi:hypothetical protein
MGSLIGAGVGVCSTQPVTKSPSQFKEGQTSFIESTTSDDLAVIAKIGTVAFFWGGRGVMVGINVVGHCSVPTFT